MACAHATSMNRPNTSGQIYFPCYHEWAGHTQATQILSKRKTLVRYREGQRSHSFRKCEANCLQFLVVALSNPDTATARVIQAYDTT
jgi:hypothetical protein